MGEFDAARLLTDLFYLLESLVRCNAYLKPSSLLNKQSAVRDLKSQLKPPSMQVIETPLVSLVKQKFYWGIHQKWNDKIESCILLFSIM